MQIFEGYIAFPARVPQSDVINRQFQVALEHPLLNT